MMHEFTNESLSKRRSLRLEEVQRMEAAAVGRAASSDVFILDTSSDNDSKNGNNGNAFQRSNSGSSANESSSDTNNEVNDNQERRPSDIEIRCLWRLRVNEMKLDELSCHSRYDSHRPSQARR